jgi:hypothetical protein
MNPSWLALGAHFTRRRGAPARGLTVALLLALAAAACTSTASSPSGLESPSAAPSPPTSPLGSPAASPSEAATAVPTPAPAPTAPPPPPPPPPTPTPTHPAAPGTVSDTTTFGVQSTWASTSLMVQPDDVLIFTATGTYRGATGQPNVNPITVNCGVPPFNFVGFPAPYLERYAVIGRVGSSGEPFCIGGGRAVKVDASGPLQVGVNTDDPAGAPGTVTVVTKRYRWAGQIPETEVTVTGGSVQSGWAGTSIIPQVGDYLIFYTIGMYRGRSGQPNVTPESVGCGHGPYTNLTFLAPMLKAYAVVGRFGYGGEPFCIGGGLTRTASAAADIQVAMNTNDTYGALGWIEVSTVRYHWP